MVQKVDLPGADGQLTELGNAHVNASYDESFFNEKGDPCKKINEMGVYWPWPVVTALPKRYMLKEVAKYQDTRKMWVYTTWPGYRYGYWFRNQVGIRPTWLFERDNAGGVAFRKFSPDATDWPEGALACTLMPPVTFISPNDSPSRFPGKTARRPRLPNSSWPAKTGMMITDGLVQDSASVTAFLLAKFKGFV